MNIRRYLPTICVAGAILGIVAITQLWIHYVDGYDWILDSTGLDLLGSSLAGFQKFIPLTVAIISAVSVAFAVLAMSANRFWYGIFICMLTGVLIMVLTSVFAMWEYEGLKMIHFADIGIWLSYASGGIIMIGAALQYSGMFLKNAKAR